MKMVTIVALVLAAAGASGPTRPATPARAPREGHIVTHWPNGHVKTDVTYHDDQYEGEYRTFYESGTPWEVRHFRAGHEDGAQQSWSESGQLYLNYEARDGRRYGLVNAAPCVQAETADGLPYYESADFTPRWQPVTHRVASFHLTTQTGRVISARDLDGRIHVASFIYTQCAAVCPQLVAQLRRVEQATRDLPDVTLVSYTVTPETDTPRALAAFGRERGIDPSRWWLVTGERDQIYRLARGSYFADDNRVGPAVGGTSTDFLHTEKVVLVDRAGHLRGIYNGTEARDVDLLVADIRRLQAVP